MATVQIEKYDVIIIGAGLSGVCSLYHLKKRFPSWRIRVLEAAESVGGTWYWNRYPGARVDSESLSYAFSFDKELRDEWHWKETFAPQSEILRYIERIADKHQLAKDIQFQTRIKTACWQDNSRTWLFTDSTGAQYQCQFFVSCMGFLSKPQLPALPGIDNFKGESFHTSRWPKNFDLSCDFANKRIGVIGTGATANKLYSDFIADKIRQRVNDPKVAESLIPKNHGFGTRRVPLESGYFDVYNKPNVHLVDLQQTPIEVITETGIKTSDGNHHDLDVLIYATGFDAITGAFSAIEWQAKDGRPLVGSSETEQGSKAIWVDHRPRTYLGLTANSMPNMFMVLGPHQPFGNAPRTVEHAVQVVSDLLEHCKDNNYTYVEPTERAVEEWTEHVVECSKGSLSNEVDSWMTGVNKNIKGKTVRSVARYSGHAAEYRRRCAECKAKGWKGFIFKTDQLQESARI